MNIEEVISNVNSGLYSSAVILTSRWASHFAQIKMLSLREKNL